MSFNMSDKVRCIGDSCAGGRPPRVFFANDDSPRPRRLDTAEPNRIRPDITRVFRGEKKADIIARTFLAHLSPGPETFQNQYW